MVTFCWAIVGSSPAFAQVPFTYDPAPVLTVTEPLQFAIGVIWEAGGNTVATPLP